MDNQEVAVAPEINKKNTQKTTLIVFSVIVLLIAGLLIYMIKTTSDSKKLTTATQPASSYIEPGINDNTDNQLNKDSDKVDISLQNLETDVSSVDTSLTDQSIDLSQ